MELVREYGIPPYRAVVLHGGPGAPGSAAGLCRGMAERMGVLEHLQAAASIDGLIAELEALLDRYALARTVLVGHSFGAWLALLFAERHPDRTEGLILVGSGPLEAEYLPEIIRTREERRRRGDTDSFCPLPGAGRDLLRFDEAQYKALMAEAMALRERGELLRRALRVRCPVTAFHGTYDPHPVRGICAPLRDKLPGFRAVVLERCGHEPWIERHARAPFFERLFEEMNRYIAD